MQDGLIGLASVPPMPTVPRRASGLSSHPATGGCRS